MVAMLSYRPLTKDIEHDRQTETKQAHFNKVLTQKQNEKKFTNHLRSKMDFKKL